MIYEPLKLTTKKRITSMKESYFPSINEIEKEILAEKNINGPVLDAATFLSTPALNQRGINTIPPPILTQAPSSPAKNPFIIPCLIFRSDIFSF